MLLRLHGGFGSLQGRFRDSAKDMLFCGSSGGSVPVGRLPHKTKERKEYRCLFSVRVFPFVEIALCTADGSIEATGGNQRRGTGTPRVRDFPSSQVRVSRMNLSCPSFRVFPPSPFRDSYRGNRETAKTRKSQQLCKRPGKHGVVLRQVLSVRCRAWSGSPAPLGGTLRSPVPSRRLWPDRRAIVRSPRCPERGTAGRACRRWFPRATP